MTLPPEGRSGERERAVGSLPSAVVGLPTACGARDKREKPAPAEERRAAGTSLAELTSAGSARAMEHADERRAKELAARQQASSFGGRALTS